MDFLCSVLRPFLDTPSVFRSKSHIKKKISYLDYQTGRASSGTDPERGGGNASPLARKPVHAPPSRPQSPPNTKNAVNALSLLFSVHFLRSALHLVSSALCHLSSVLRPLHFLLCLLVLLSLPVAVHAQFTFTTNNGAITITGYTGPGGAVTIPSTTNGLPVTRIGNSAFRSKPSLTSVTLPDSVINIGTYAFSSCASLAGIAIGSNVTSIGDYTFFGCTALAVSGGENEMQNWRIGTDRVFWLAA